MFWQCLLCYSCPFPLVLSLDIIEKSLAPSLNPPFKYLYTLERSPLSLLFSRLISLSSLNLSSQERCSSPSRLWPFVGLSSPRPCLPCTGESRIWTQHMWPHIRYGLTSAEQMERITSLIWPHSSQCTRIRVILARNRYFRIRSEHLWSKDLSQVLNIKSSSSSLTTPKLLLFPTNSIWDNNHFGGWVFHVVCFGQWPLTTGK